MNPLSLLRWFRQHPLLDSVLVLAAVSCIGCFIVLFRSVATGRSQFFFLVWNLCLAWLPLVMVVVIEEFRRRHLLRGWRFVATFAAWVLVLPNAPYILTDLVHLQRSLPNRWWTDLTLILWFSIAGLMLGFIALRRMQAMLAESLGRTPAWLVTVGLIPVVAFGIYIGRFERWNSWDVLVRPLDLLADAPNWFHRGSIKFTVLFSLLLGACHLMLVTTGALLNPVPRKPHDI